MSFDKIKNRKCFGQKRHCPLGSTGGGGKTGDDNTAKIDVLGSKNVI
jgi:hypothetical protein